MSAVPAPNPLCQGLLCFLDHRVHGDQYAIVKAKTRRLVSYAGSLLVKSRTSCRVRPTQTARARVMLGPVVCQASAQTKCSKLGAKSQACLPLQLGFGGMTAWMARTSRLLMK